MTDVRPLVAIVCANSLTVVGLRQLLQSVMPSIEVEAFASASELQEGQPERFFHYFVDISILLTDRSFFSAHRHRTIVLTTAPEHAAQLADFHCVCVTGGEKALVKSLLQMMRRGHPHGEHISHGAQQRPLLSPREVEVLSLLARGFINKEIADRLCISLTTVITHRKNIVEKLGMRSVSALTIYAVMNGYVDLEQI